MPRGKTPKCRWNNDGQKVVLVGVRAIGVAAPSDRALGHVSRRHPTYSIRPADVLPCVMASN
jgi:hypothetical protein